MGETKTVGAFEGGIGRPWSAPVRSGDSVFPDIADNDARLGRPERMDMLSAAISFWIGFQIVNIYRRGKFRHSDEPW